MMGRKKIYSADCASVPVLFVFGLQAQLVADTVRNPYIQVTLETGSSVSLASLAANDAKARVQKTRKTIPGKLLYWTLMRLFCRARGVKNSMQGCYPVIFKFHTGGQRIKRDARSGNFEVTWSETFEVRVSTRRCSPWHLIII